MHPRLRAGRFARHRGGASAVEFALLAAPFLALLGVVAESGLVALEQQTLVTLRDATSANQPSTGIQMLNRRYANGGRLRFEPCALISGA